MAYPRQSAELSPEEFVRLAQSLLRDPTASGETVRRFETSLAGFVGAPQAVSFGSQRSGMVSVLRTLKPRPGDEVIVPAYTFFSVPACVVLAGFRPVFADVDPFTWNLDPLRVKAAVTERTRAVIATHLNGCPADLDLLTQIAEERHLLLIEDCAQALGAAYRSRPVGSFGVGCFSFGDGKNLLTMGGGMITTQDASLAARLREGRDQAHAPSFPSLLGKVARLLALRMLTTPAIFTITAYPYLYALSFANGRVDTDKEHRIEAMSERFLEQGLSNAQAALGLAQLGALAERNQKRIDNARWLTDALAVVGEITLPPQPKERTHLYTHYAVRVKDRERFVRSLIRLGIDAQRDYCSFCPKLPDFQSAGPVKAPAAQELDGSVAYLPNQPGLGKHDILRIARAVREVLRS